MITKIDDFSADILRSAVEGWTDAHTVAAKLDAEVRRRIADSTDGVEDRNAATDALRAAESTADLQSICDADRLATARREAASADIALLALARDRAQLAVKNLEEHSAEDVVYEIRTRVENIASKVHGLRHRPLSAQEALDLDAAQEWRTLQQLTKEWTSLARSYMTLVRREVDGQGVSALASAAFTGDPLNVHPFFQERRKEAGKASARPRPDSFHEVQLRWSDLAPAPKFNADEPRGGAVPRGDDPIQWLAHLVENNALTVYGPQEALDIWAAATAATDRLTADSAESRAQARVEYARLLGDEQLETVEDLRPLVEQGKRRGPRGAFFG